MGIEAKKRVEKHFTSDGDELQRALAGEKVEVKLETKLDELVSKMDICDKGLLTPAQSFVSAYEGCDYKL